MLKYFQFIDLNAPYFRLIHCSGMHWGKKLFLSDRNTVDLFARVGVAQCLMMLLTSEMLHS